MESKGQGCGLGELSAVGLLVIFLSLLNGATDQIEIVQKGGNGQQQTFSFAATGIESKTSAGSTCLDDAGKDLKSIPNLTG